MTNVDATHFIRDDFYLVATSAQSAPSQSSQPQSVPTPISANPAPRASALDRLLRDLIRARRYYAATTAQRGRRT
jgi:hypothetical protein